MAQTGDLDEVHPPYRSTNRKPKKAATYHLIAPSHKGRETLVVGVVVRRGRVLVVEQESSDVGPIEVRFVPSVPRSGDGHRVTMTMMGSHGQFAEVFTREAGKMRSVDRFSNDPRC